MRRLRRTLGRLFVRALVFISVFTLDVRVKAEHVSLPMAENPLQEPEGCLLRASVCALRTRAGERFELRMGEARVILDARTIVIRQTQDSLLLVAGTVWVNSEAEFSVRTEYGEARSESGEFWVSREPGRMKVSATDGTLRLRPRGQRAQVLRLEAGEENWLGGIDRSGVATSGVPTSIPFDAHVRRWARLYPGGRRAFEKDVRRFARSWSRALAGVVTYHEELMVRRRGILAAEAERRARAKDREEARSAELRSLYRRKTLLD